MYYLTIATDLKHSGTERRVMLGPYKFETKSERKLWLEDLQSQVSPKIEIRGVLGYRPAARPAPAVAQAIQLLQAHLQ